MLMTKLRDESVEAIQEEVRLTGQHDEVQETIIEHPTVGLDVSRQGNDNGGRTSSSSATGYRST